MVTAVARTRTAPDAPASRRTDRLGATGSKQRRRPEGRALFRNAQAALRLAAGRC
jgi:hypothetical protein